MRRAAVDQHALQGGILCGYGFPRAAHVFARFDDRDGARRWLAALRPLVQSAAPWGEAGKPERTVNVALSVPGLALLGVPTRTLAAFPADVREGMAWRAPSLGDTGADGPGAWDDGLDDREAHVVVTVHAREDSSGALARALAALPAPEGVHVLATEHCAVLPHGREHFGFGDGLAQPALADDRAGPWHGLGTPRRGGPVSSWEPLAVGEFVLGHPDEDGRRPPAPPAPFDTETTYLVLRKLEQHVDVWRRWLHERSGGDPATAARIAAQLVGRWPNGTPLVRSPDRPDPRLDDPALRAEGLDEAARRRRFELLNDFGYRQDPEGERCPLTAHVRRSNPRNAFGDGRRLRRHRMVRRGMPYGPAVPAEAPADDGASRGLWFACFVASISRQFEIVQRDWLNDGDAFGCGADRDVVAGAASADGKVVLPGDPPRVLGPVPRVVTLRGGGYFVVPSLPALAELAP